MLRSCFSRGPSLTTGRVCSFEVLSYFTTGGQSDSMSWYRAPLWDLRPDILPVAILLPEICALVSVGCPLWREDGSAICSVITQLSESRRTRNHILLSHLRLPQPGGPGSRIYIPQVGPVIPPGTGQFVKVKMKVKVKSRYDWLTGVEPTFGLASRYQFCLNCTVLSLLGALSDERSGLSLTGHCVATTPFLYLNIPELSDKEYNLCS
jgi:hypothetical protein